MYFNSIKNKQLLLFVVETAKKTDNICIHWSYNLASKDLTCMAVDLA